MSDHSPSSPASTVGGDASQRYRPAEPDDRAWTARENLTDIIEREILGPADGGLEVIQVTPDTRYLVGRIAPAKLTGPADQTVGSAEEDDEEVLAAALTDTPDGRGVPAVGAQDNALDGSEDDVEDQPQRRGLMIPASMGLRFQVPTGLASFRARCGLRNARPEVSASPSPRCRVHRSFPVGIESCI